MARVPGKPSEKEEEYFVRKESERLRALAEERRARLAAEELEQRRKLHHMRCPKCGDELDELPYKAVKIDKCPSCHGIWLDQGELDQILEAEDDRLMKRLIRVFKP